MNTITDPLHELSDFARNPFKPVITEPTSYELAILRGLQDKHPIYQGTVPAHVKAARRATNKAARIARRANR